MANLEFYELDEQINAILKSEIDSDEKALQYFNVIQEYMSKSNSKFKDLNIIALLNENNQLRYLLKPKKKRNYLIYLPSIIGPLIGFCLTTLLR
jgi:spore coat polysaccharide biosynthesis protein SpsF (cytidylyltransferase family)